jgi:hypothetical protein
MYLPDTMRLEHRVYGGGEWNANYHGTTGVTSYPGVNVDPDVLLGFYGSGGAYTTASLNRTDYQSPTGSFSGGGSSHLATGHYLIMASPVPIPAAVWLFSSGLLGLISIARRKKAA